MVHSPTPPATTGEGYEFPFTQQDFETLRTLVTQQTGIVLPDNKKTMMYTRLVRRLRVLQLPDFATYVQRVQHEISKGDQTETLLIVNAMTTNVTAFFREQHHFDHLAQQLPLLLERFGQVHIWSCACSSGQEPWSIAMVVADYLRHTPAAKITITASDIDANMLQQAAAGQYMLEPKDVDAYPLLRRYLEAETATPEGYKGTAQAYRVKDSLRGKVTFKQQNLLQAWRVVRAPVHVVFCRNVIIYFAKESKCAIFEQMAQTMPQEGVLYLGHSESLLGVSDAFSALGKTTYVRRD